jgi:Flp pilus assembly protein TadD
MSSSAPELTPAQTKASARLARHASMGAALTKSQKAFARGALGKALGLAPEDLRFALRIAADHMRRGDLAEALRTYGMLVLCEPMNADFQIGLANCALQMDENHLAVQAASAVIALRPDDFRGYYLSGRASLVLRRRDEAEEDLREALVLAEKAGDRAFAREIAALVKKLEALKPIAST